MKFALMVCDDLEEERVALVRMLRNYAARHGVELTVETAAGGEELLSLWAPGRWDIVFLDIYMPGLSGVEAARSLRERDRTCALMFATASRDHGIEGYALGVTEYLLKPFSQRDVDEALDWYIKEHAVGERLLRLWVDWDEIGVPLGDILYIEVQDHLALVHTGGQVIRTNRGLDSLEQEIGEARFLRCHRSFLVNLEHVRELTNRDFLMDSGDLVPISRLNLPRVRQTFSEWRMLRAWERRQ